MRAITVRRYGGPEVLAVEEVDTPSPGEGEVLIRVEAVGVSAGDVFIMRGEPQMVRLAFGLRGPRQPVIGRDVAGEVAAVGAGVTRFAVGDRVFAEAEQGGWAEYVVVPERFVVRRPTSVDAVHAAAVPVSGITALQGLRLAGLQPGQRLLVNGASGGVGGFAVQLGVAMGAEVTGVCRGAKADHVLALGAHEVIDHTREDFTAPERSGRPSGYDVIFDLVADHPLARLRRALTHNGTLVLSSGRGGRVTGPMGRLAVASVVSPFVSQRLRPLVAKRSRDDLAELARRIDAGEVRPAVDEVFPLEQAAEAVRRFEAGEVRGKLVLAVQ